VARTAWFDRLTVKSSGSSVLVRGWRPPGCGPHMVITNHGVIPANAGIQGAGDCLGFGLSGLSR